MSVITVITPDNKKETVNGAIYIKIYKDDENDDQIVVRGTFYTNKIYNNIKSLNSDRIQIDQLTLNVCALHTNQYLYEYYFTCDFDYVTIKPLRLRIETHEEIDKHLFETTYDEVSKLNDNNHYANINAKIIINKDLVDKDGNSIELYTKGLLSIMRLRANDQDDLPVAGSLYTKNYIEDLNSIHSDFCEIYDIEVTEELISTEDYLIRYSFTSQHSITLERQLFQDDINIIEKTLFTSFNEYHDIDGNTFLSSHINKEMYNAFIETD